MPRISLVCPACGKDFTQPPAHVARRRTHFCSSWCAAYGLPCQNGHHRPPETAGHGCVTCRANRATWYGHGRNLKADLAWAKALAPEVEMTYDQWVELLRTVVFPPRVYVPKVTLLQPEMLEWIAAGDSFGQRVESYV